jgi:hypothetical protein
VVQKTLPTCDCGQLLPKVLKLDRWRWSLRPAKQPVWVKMRKPHVEQNESALTLIADVPRDMDFRRNGP